MLEWMTRRLKLQPDEARRALALGTIIAGVTGSYTLAKTVRDAFFLSQLPATLLPYVYLTVGVLTAFASVLVTRVTRRHSLWESLAGAALFTATSLAAFAQLFRFQAPWVPVAFYLWVNIYGLILVSQFWVYANGISHSREAKRTFGMVGVGAILGGLLGGLVAAPLARLWSLPSLLNVAAVLQVAVVPLICLKSNRAVVAEPAADTTSSPQNPLRHSYVRWLALATLCSVMVAALLDYQFKVQIQRRYPTSGELASFLGLFYTATNLAAVLFQVLATRWMIQRLGAAWSASLLPIGLGAATAVTIAAPGFGAVAAARLWDQVTRLSVSKAAGELFYFPIEPGLRRRAKAFIQAGVERLGDGLAGLVILAAGITIGAGTLQIALVVAGLLAIWVVAWLRVRRGYVVELGRNLRRLNLDEHQSRISLREASLLNEIVHLLASRYERVVLRGIDMLAENAPEELERRLDVLLGHASPRVRAHALKIARQRGIECAPGRIGALMHDEDPEVRVQALSTHSEGDLLGALEGYLRSDDEKLRVAAILCVTEQAPSQEEGRIRLMLEELLASGTRAERAAVAEALGRREAPFALHDLLAPLFKDRDLAVRRAALRSAGAAQRRTHVPALIEALGARETQEAARAALATLGDRVVGTLGDYLSDASVPLEVRHAIPRALGDIPSQESANALFRYRERGDVRLSYRVLKAGNRIRGTGAPVRFSRRLITEDIEYDARSFLFALVHYRSCPIGRGPGAERLLCIALNERMEQALNRVFRRLQLLYPPEEILAAYQGIVSADARMRGNALEYLENALTPEHRGLVLPLADDTGDDGRLRLAEARHGIRYTGFEQTLEAILKEDDPWLRACALYVVGTRKDRAMLPLVESNLTTLNKLVRETATWARLAIATG